MTTSEFPDERLKLLFVCAHPAIDAAMHTPLMLQTVLGLNAVRIASAFLVSPDAMAPATVTRQGQDQGCRHSRSRCPKPGNWRLVCTPCSRRSTPPMAAAGTIWRDPQSRWLPGEAITIGSTLVELMPDEPEALGLLSLMLHCEARREARRDDLRRLCAALGAGRRALVAADDRRGRATSGPRRQGRPHRTVPARGGDPVRACAARRDRRDRLGRRYRCSMKASSAWHRRSARWSAAPRRSPKHATPKPALAMLEELPAERVATYQPYWALAAHLLARLQRSHEAREAYARAIGLCSRRRHAQVPDRPRPRELKAN